PLRTSCDYAAKHGIAEETAAAPDRHTRLAAQLGGGLAQQRVKQHRFDAGLAEDRSNQLAVPVEAGGLPNHALDVVGHERAEECLDLVVGQLGEEATEIARDAQVRAELRPPPRLIDVKVLAAQSVVSQGSDQCFCRKAAGEQAVE